MLRRILSFPIIGTFSFVVFVMLVHTSNFGELLPASTPITYIPLRPSYMLLDSNQARSRSFLDYSTSRSNSTKNEVFTYLNVCPVIPPSLKGVVNVSQEIVSLDYVQKLVGMDVTTGGRYSPKECVARHKVAIVIPLRNRPTHLPMFLKHMHPLLKRQQLDYGIYVVNQIDSNDFNRAMLFNVGFVEAMKDANWDCFIFHDVDLLPEDDRNLYTCPESPRHMSVAVSTKKYKLTYPKMFGGVVALTKSHLFLVNGFANQFWGWGGEDDDMAGRIIYHGMNISRYNDKIARYTMLRHKKEAPSKFRHQTLKEGRKLYGNDGFNNLKYQLVMKEELPLFTNLSVILEPVAIVESMNETAK